MSKSVLMLPLMLVLIAPLARAQAPTNATHYDPLKVHNYYLSMSSTDWTTVKGDSTFTIEKPAWFCDNTEAKILIAVRRKPTLAVSNKVSLKFDINQYFDGTVWHGVKKASLENGQQSTAGPISEGLGWYVHVKAGEYLKTKGIDYQPGKFTFANVYVNGVNQGLYTSVEQVDKQFLRNRSLWTAGETWLYKQQDVNTTEQDEGPTATSPTLSVLNYQPFNTRGPTPPGQDVVATQLSQYVNMDAWLTMGAVNAFTANPDNLFAKGKNYFWSDYQDNLVTKRHYFPWDLDAVFPGTNVNGSIYGGGNLGTYADLVLGNPAFRGRYNEIMLDLLSGPLSVSSLHAYLNQLQPIISPHVLADPNNGIGDPALKFQQLRDFITARHANILSQVNADMAAVGREAVLPEPACPMLVLLAASAVLRRRRTHV
jgi:spore coat protein CotH